jgi:putative ABC transport system ATP-binding protein
MDNATSGKINFCGEEITEMAEEKLAELRLTKLGFVFQQSNLLKNLSIFDNIIVSAFLSGKESKKDINKRAISLMEQTGIVHLKNNDVTQVSGGEMQRTAICRALINNPSIVFGDEPTGALNTSTTNEIMDIFCDLNAKGTTIMLVTHDAKVAARSDGILFIALNC